MGGIGAAATVAGAGIGTLSGSAAASEVSISGGDPGSVTNDRGDVTQVTIDPSFSVSWEGLDDGVAKVFYLIEAKVGSGNWQPIFRATPWLPAGTENTSYVKSKSGTTGEYTLKQPHSMVLNQDERFGEGESAAPLVVADEEGKPEYSDLNYANHPDSSSVDETSYLNGTSMGTAREAEEFLQDGNEVVLQNNFTPINAGYYGAAADTSELDNENDNGEGNPNNSQSTTVQLRYTFELQRPNDGWAASRAGIESEDHEDLAAEIPGIQASDIVDGNSPIVMNGEDGNTNFSNPTGISYNQIHNNADDHVGVLMAKTSFDVTAINESSESGVTGSSNPGVTDGGQS